MEQNEKSGKLLEVKDLRVSFFTPAGEVKAVSGISYDLDYDEVMGIVGESGSGKTTLLRCLNFLETADAGQLTFDGETFDLAHADRASIETLLQTPPTTE